jgi:hypothetical protein
MRKYPGLDQGEGSKVMPNRDAVSRSGGTGLSDADVSTQLGT